MGLESHRAARGGHLRGDLRLPLRLGLYGIALAAVGMLATIGIVMTRGRLRPHRDNAGGISEMAGLGPERAQSPTSSTRVGNTTAAIGKGFAIGSAVLTALALFAAYHRGGAGSNEHRPHRAPGRADRPLPRRHPALPGRRLTMSAVGRAAGGMVEEVRRQFREIPGLMEGTAKADTRPLRRHRHQAPRSRR